MVPIFAPREDLFDNVFVCLIFLYNKTRYISFLSETEVVDGVMNDFLSWCRHLVSTLTLCTAHFMRHMYIQVSF